MTASGLRVIVGGMLAGVPFQPGATWAVLQYVLGLRGLGHEVLVVEPVSVEALSDPNVRRYFRSVTEDFDLTDRFVLLGRGSRQTHGLSYEKLLAEASRADLLLNLSGLVTDDVLLGLVPVRVYVDLDPAFTQLWEAVCGIDMHFASHDRFVTVGLAVGSAGNEVPTCGRKWITTTPPVSLDHWPVADTGPDGALTTVANWRGYGSITHDGVFYGQKAHSMRELVTLPSRMTQPHRLALAIDPGETTDLDALDANGWNLVARSDFPRTTGDYHHFVQRSKGELGIAKSGYVRSRCGWFSDRSACYLASGRPVVAQDTGFSSFLPCGSGLLAFDDVDGAAVAVEDIDANYDTHRHAARDIAASYLDAGKVLPALLNAVGSTS